MYKVHVTSEQPVILNGQIVTIQAQVYNVDNIDFCKENDFIQCGKCKEWFDESWEIGLYHPEYDERKQKVYCKTCFDCKYN